MGLLVLLYSHTSLRPSLRLGLIPRRLVGENTKMAARRSEMEIIADILEVALEPRNRTRLMYRTNLSFFQANRYFRRLLEKGLIAKIDGSKDKLTYYRTTEKGEILLKTLNRAEEFLAVGSAVPTMDLFKITPKSGYYRT